MRSLAALRIKWTGHELLVRPHRPLHPLAEKEKFHVKESKLIHPNHPPSWRHRGGEINRRFKMNSIQLDLAIKILPPSLHKLQYFFSLSVYDTRDRIKRK